MEDAAKAYENYMEARAGPGPEPGPRIVPIPTLIAVTQ